MVTDLIRSMRPRQWIKNVFVFAAPLFSKIVIDRPRTLFPVVIAFFLLSFLSASVYLLNDVIDRENDRQHPRKCRRPIAAGKVSPRAAILTSIVLFGASMGGAILLRRWGPANGYFVLILGAYFLLNLAYSLVLKHVVILDVLVLAMGFVLRAMAGANVVSVEISPWLLLCTFLISLFLALSKRRHELVLLNEGAHSHRQILKEYSPYLLDQMIGVVTASTVMGYALYAMNEEVQTKLGTDKRFLGTIVFVLYGIFRYLYLVHQKSEGGDPSELILSDKWLLANMLLWAMTVFLVLAF
jgi:4-hydroxybenzoate polyprenyltransferase